MKEELRERREETWNLLVVNGMDYSKVVERLSEKYGVAESTISTDINRMDDWLPKLDRVSQKSGHSRLKELRQNRQRLQQMALEARQDGDLEKELQIRRQIDKAIERDVSLAQSLGLTIEEPEKHEHSAGEDGAPFSVNIVHESYSDDDTESGPESESESESE